MQQLLRSVNTTMFQAATAADKSRSWGPQVLLSSGAFAGSHLAPLQDAAPLAALGCALACTAVASGGSLAAATLAHALYNAAVLAGALR